MFASTKLRTQQEKQPVPVILEEKSDELDVLVENMDSDEETDTLPESHTRPDEKV